MIISVIYSQAVQKITSIYREIVKSAWQNANIWGNLGERYTGILCCALVTFPKFEIISK